MPKVSILSPTYQHAAFIGDCIRSALAQTFQDWEMVIVDDGSDDGLLKLPSRLMIPE